MAEVPGARLEGDGRTPVYGIQVNSRDVVPGDMFVAVKGFRADGNQFIPEALQRGAVAIVTERAEVAARCPVSCLVVPDTRLALALLASAFHGHPSKPLGMVGITGTDGKTTTATMLHHLLTRSGRPAGLLSTTDIRIGCTVMANDTDLTTPEAPTLQRILREMVNAGLSYAVVEVSSHALHLQRVASCHFDVGVFTNLTPEHLDFHGDFDRYLATKAQLFTKLGQSGNRPCPPAAVLNVDDPVMPQLAAVTKVPVVTYGILRPADVRARRIERSGPGIQFEIISSQGKATVWTRLDGRFNVYNWLAATAAALALGVPFDAVPSAVETMEPVRGRLQPIECGQPFRLLVDFAHTPNGLQQTLHTLREDCERRLLAVLGHPGGRDRKNRPLLGSVAASLCDFFVITGDDPYHEKPESAIAEIAEGARAAGAVEGRDFLRILDRRAAFAEAFARARTGDTVLLAGRGHLSQWVANGSKKPFDDAVVARSLLSGLT